MTGGTPGSVSFGFIFGGGRSAAFMHGFRKVRMVVHMRQRPVAIIRTITGEMQFTAWPHNMRKRIKVCC